MNEGVSDSIEQGIWKWTGGWETSSDRPQRDYARSALSNRKKYFQKRNTRLDQFTDEVKYLSN